MSDKNIDKAIETLKQRLEPNRYGGKCALGYSEKYCFGVNDMKAIENVLSELETNKKAVDNLLVKNAELKQDVQDFQQALNEENLRCSFYVIANNDLREKLQIQGKELETYKKIAEKLADTLRYYNGMQQVQEFCIDICEDKLCDEENCKQCIIDWARKEVENEIQKSN